MNAGLTRRAGPFFGVWLVVAAVLATFAPMVPAVSATDPTPDPSASLAASSPSDAPSDAPSIAPDSPSPAPEPTLPADSPSPSAAPTPTPDPTAAPDPSATVDPSPSDAPPGSPEPSPSVAPSATPDASPSLDPKAAPQLLGLATTLDPTSPHVISGLDSDTCAACHAAHRATNAGLLSNVYRASPLRLSGEPYRATDFGLCFSCHSGGEETAIEDTTGTSTGTNFPSHGIHLQLIGSFGGGGVDITVPGDGQGNALCAECHDNLHGTAGDPRGLVRFAPDVVPYNGLPIAYDETTGTCTLTCHGVGHDGAVVPAP